MFLLKLSVLLDECVDPVNHLLYELDLAVSEPVLVADVVGHSSLAARLASSSSRLDLKLFTSLLERW